MRKTLSREEIRASLTGPVASLRTVFLADGAIDESGVRACVDFAIAAGSRTVLLTFGDSLYSVLTDAEVAEVTKTVAAQAAGRAVVVAADRQWWTGKAVEFARYAREVGADVVMVLPPDWGASCTVQSLVGHYAAVAREAPVMVVTGVFRPRGMGFGLEVLARLRDDAPGIAAVKDDYCGEFGRRMCLLVHDRCAVIAGGQKQNHLDLLSYGCDGYLSTFITFRPEVAHAYWSAVTTNDLAGARSVIRDFDMPFFDFIVGLPGGFDAGIHGCYEICGIAGRWRRKPYHSLTDGEMERLKEFLDKSP